VADFHSGTDDTAFLSWLGQNGPAKELAFRRGEWFTPVLNKVESIPSSPKVFSAQHTYLITGGTSGLGLIFAEWLADRGVRYLALVSRTGMKVETAPVVDKLKAKGVQMEVFSADITSTSDLSRLIMEVETALPTIKGVVHAAGLLEDGAFMNLSADQFNKVIAPKVEGAKNLHQYFAKRTLDDFILFSSGASVLGTAAQGNYTAANMVLDQLAQQRKANGLAALSINFGNIGETGLAAADIKRGERLKEQGMGVLLPAQLPALFDALFALPAAQYMLMDIDFAKWADTNPGVKGNLFFSKVLPVMTSAMPTEETDKKKFPNMAAAVRHFRNSVKQHISSITKVPVAKIKEDATFKSMGIDSLMAVQLKNKLQAEFELTLAVSSIWTYPTVEKYADFLIDELKVTEQFAAPVPEASADEKSVDEMSLEELMKALEEKSK
jgi:NAD(P)-dependent dehydrogenase (short-subunit alcohol dehydrogenase family)/acyl carrier protein